MIFTETKLKGAFVIEAERIGDERGFFARIFDAKAFENNGIHFNLVESSVSFNRKEGTLRGMHYQDEPHAETKIVRCTRGKMFDVIVDLRKKSKTYKEWFGVELSSENRKMLLVPKGFAHGFMTLEDDTEITYQMDQAYSPGRARGLMWNDKAFDIKWPIKPTIISAKDSSWDPFTG